MTKVKYSKERERRQNKTVDEQKTENRLTVFNNTDFGARSNKVNKVYDYSEYNKTKRINKSIKIKNKRKIAQISRKIDKSTDNNELKQKQPQGTHVKDRKDCNI